MEEFILEQILDGTKEPTDLTLETLRNITDNFSSNRIIGEGGFGTVYKGALQNGNVAVKKIMNSMTINEKLFRREVDSLMEVNHENVVKFLGFCSHTVHTPVKNPEGRGYIYAEKRERLLCFEYISNGSLDTHITDELRGLEWDTRYKVIKGICTGLYYLHMEKGILHMDLKPANILLDNNMVPKITDFGLSRPTENSRTTSTDHFASPGYGAPENLFCHGRMSVKSDIYSLGKIIMELVTGHKDIPDDDNNYNILRRWRHRWNKSAVETPIAYQQQVIKFIEIGIMCQSVDPYKRPFISHIMNEIGEMESIINNIRNADEHTVFQTNSAYWEDDMLGVEPLELRFSNSEQNKDISLSSCSVELSNNTNGFIAFNIQTTSPLPYCIDPNNNIVLPQSKLSVNITLPEAAQYHDKKYKEQFIVRSTKVNEEFAAKDINQYMFDKGKYIDEVDLAVVTEAHREVPSPMLIPSKEESQDLLIRCIAHHLGFSGNRPVAACIIYKCLLHWGSFEEEQTTVFSHILQTIGHEIETQDNEVLAYWLSNASTLLILLQRTLKGHRGTPQVVNLALTYGSIVSGGEALRQVKAKHPALLFKKQLEAYIEKIYRMIRDNWKKEITPLLGLCIQAPKTLMSSLMKRSSRSETNTAAHEALIAHWKGIVKILGDLLNILEVNNVPPFLMWKVFTQIFSLINVQLFNSLLLKRESCAFSNGEYIKAGLAQLEEWCCKATAELQYAHSAWGELNHIRQAAGFLVIHQKLKKTLEEVTHDLCPALSIHQIYRICTMFSDDKYGTHNVSPEVISNMRVLMTEDNNAVSSSLLLDDDTSIPFSVGEMSKSMEQIDISDIEPPPFIRENAGFRFLLPHATT